VHQLTRRSVPGLGWVAPRRSFPVRHPYAVAVGALLLGFLLLGGQGTFALWNDTQAGAPVIIKTGNLSATISAPVVGHTAMAAAPAGVVVRAGSNGMVPGVQAETITYTVTNTGSAGVPAKLSFVTFGHRDAATATAWAAIQPHLTATVSATGTGSVALPTAGITTTDAAVATFTSAVIVQPGASVNIVFTFSLPASGGTPATDYPRTLQQYRAGNGISVSSLLLLHPVVTLTQVPRHS